MTEDDALILIAQIEHFRRAAVVAADAAELLVAAMAQNSNLSRRAALAKLDLNDEILMWGQRQRAAIAAADGVCHPLSHGRAGDRRRPAPAADRLVPAHLT